MQIFSPSLQWLFFLNVLKILFFHLHYFNLIIHNKTIFGCGNIMAKFLE